MYEIFEWGSYHNITSIIEKHLKGRNLYAAISDESMSDENGEYHIASFYDENKTELTGIICKEIMMNPDPMPRASGSMLIFNAKLSFVSQDGRIFLHPESNCQENSSLDLFTIMLTRLIDDSTLPRMSIVAPANTSCFVLDGGSWKRGNLIRCINDAQFNVFLVDFGDTKLVDKKNIVLASALDESLEFVKVFPIQVIFVFAGNVRFREKW